MARRQLADALGVHYQTIGYLEPFPRITTARRHSRENAALASLSPEPTKRAGNANGPSR